MTQSYPSICPYLGLAGEPTTTRTGPDTAHRCFAQQPVAAPDLSYQVAYCLSAAHDTCPFHDGADRRVVSHSSESSSPNRQPWRLWSWIALAAIALIAIAIYARDLLRPAASPAAPPIAVLPSPSPSLTPAPSPILTVAARAVVPTNTSEPGGRVLTLSPKAEEAGWFDSSEAGGNHLGDSFLYAGYFEGRAFISALRIELGSVPRGAPIRAATLALAGLNDSRFDPAAGGAWTAQLVTADALPDFAGATFQELFNAPTAVTLVPALYPADLGAGQTNTWVLDSTGRAWLEQQLLDGAPAVIARLSGPAGGADTLFAWDSGTGAATLGESPQLMLNLGAAPPTPPPLPTEAVIVATSTATPANVLTIAAEAWTATAVATTLGTYTPLPYRAVTPTPWPANLATVQAIAVLNGLPPIVQHTPTPGNAATAEADAALATAQAFLTGTPTATPKGAVTPVVLTPTPIPTNVLTAAARYFRATAEAATTGTPTPWPYNAVVATTTPPWIVITSTPAPGNAATAQAQAAYATAVSLVIGTFTPLPPNAATPTPAGFVPRPTTAAPPAQAETPAAGAVTATCPDPRVQITSPTAGQVVSGVFLIYGRAVHAAFALAILEVASGSPPAGDYVEFGRFDFPIAAGLIGWPDAPLADGIYTLRLTVRDEAGNVLPACEVAITVQN